MNKIKKIVRIVILSIVSFINIFLEDQGVGEKQMVKLNTIANLNNKYETGSHVDEEVRSLELDYRSKVALDRTQSLRFGDAHYPRLKKISDNNYIMFFQYQQHGQHLYFSRSTDLVTWTAPEVLLNSSNFKITYPGSEEWSEERRFFATADATVLQNGDVLAVCSYRAWHGYSRYPDQNGIALLRSMDGGITWNNEPESIHYIYTGTNWEPYILQLETGEIQIYFTHIAPKIYLNGYKDGLRSSGTAMLRSYDNGQTWIPNVTEAPYEAYRVAQQELPQELAESLLGEPVGTDEHGNPIKYFTDQMPVAVELLDGSIALVLESRNRDGEGNYAISFAYSNDNWKHELGIDEEGPVDRQNNIFRGAGPYVTKFPSGETVISYNFKSRFWLRGGDSSAREFDEAYEVFPEITGYWGSIETISPHSLVAVFPQVTSSTARNNSINLGVVYLNHRIDIPKQTINIDGSADEWTDNTDTLFIGNESQAQTTFRLAYDNKNVYLLAERLDYFLTDYDTIEVFLAQNHNGKHIKLELSPSGLVSLKEFHKGVYKTLDSTKIKVHTTVLGTLNDSSDTDMGYLIELAIPNNLISFSQKRLMFNAIMYNSDNGEEPVEDTFTNIYIDDTKTWIPVNIIP